MLGLVFAFAAGLQFNDPDPLAWSLIYGAAAIAMFVRSSGLFPALAALVPGLVALVWGGVVLVGIQGPVDWPAVVGDVGMKTVQVELVREAAGLFLIAFVMVPVGIARLRANLPAAGSADRDG